MTVTAQNTKPKFLPDIDIAKGIGIFLVVLGHIVTGKFPEGHEWYRTFRNIIYCFHMPFFMYLSGFVFFYSYKPIHNFSAYLSNKFLRLIVPFLIFGILIVVGKYIMSHYVHVDNVPDTIVGGLLKIFGSFNQSPVRAIWYVFVLFVYCVITPIFITIIHYLLKIKPFEAIGFLTLCVLVVIAIIFQTMMLFKLIPDIMFLERIFYFYLFFIIGGLCASVDYTKVLNIYDRYQWYFLAIFVISFAVFLCVKNYFICKTIIGIWSIPALHSLSRIDFFKGHSIHQKIWRILGQNSYIIYLFNLIMIGITKALIFKITLWHGVNFWWILPILILSGSAMPIILNTFIISKIPFINKILK